MSVSPKYIESLSRRYARHHPAWLAPERNAVIPFGTLPNDLVEAGKRMSKVAATDKAEIAIHYVGAGGPIMGRSFTLICRALADLRAKGYPQVNRVKIRLFGTTSGWKAGDARFLQDVAHRAGVGDLIDEQPGRVSYRRSLELLLQGNGALILGVDDEGYMPSKLFTYALSGKPLLACFRRESPAYAEFQRAPGLGHALWFDAQREMATAEAAREMGIFLEECAGRQVFDRRRILEPHLASAMTRKHAELFEKCIAKQK